MIYVYRTLWVLLSPIVDLMVLYRFFKGKEEKKRFKERLGVASLARPEGKLVWFHGASVGESLSILPVIDLVLKQNPNAHVLVTTGTITSAALMAKRLPERAFHQYVPLDYYWSVKRFMKHWQPDLSVFVESEFWPELCHQAPNAIIINGRMSDRSARRYKRLGKAASWIFSKFKTALVQSDVDFKNFTSATSIPTEIMGNLKFDAPALPVDESKLAELQKQLEGKKVFVAASTHDGEDVTLAQMAKRVQSEVPELITVIVPRHPSRGVSIFKDLEKAGFKSTRRGAGENISALYIADTIGELGLWYRLADVVFIGKSLVSGGGQNPFESLKCHKVTLCGPSMENFKEMMRVFKEREIILQSENVADLEKDLVYFLKNDKQRALAEKRIAENIQGLGGASEKAAQFIMNLLEGYHHNA